MRNLITGILAAAVVILGFFAYQSSQQVTALQADLASRAEAFATLEADKTALAGEVELSKGAVDAATKAAADATAAHEAEASALAEKVAALEAEATAAQDQLAAMEADKAALTEQVGSLEAEKATLAEQAASLQAKIDEMAAAAPATEPATNP
ncbi:MAG: hypothetical protein NTW20_15385 [Rhodobacterales bacterium]|nr:hypothetical protein [Rhodobacterales bacterium]